MKKRIVYVLIALCACVAPGTAQILKGTFILNPQVTNINVGSSRTHETGGGTIDLGLHFDGGTFILDNLAVLVGVGGDFAWNKGYINNQFDLQAGARYYPIGGLFIGANLGYTHAWKKIVPATDFQRFNYLYVGAELGYAFFVCQNVSIDPAIYWKHSFLDRHSQHGLKVGFSIYL